MIYTSTQVELGGGNQQIELSCDSNPSSVDIYWDGGSFTTPLSYDGIYYSFVAMVPAAEFWIRLDTEDIYIRYVADYDPPTYFDASFVELEFDGTHFKVPYCDLSKLDIDLYDSDMNPLETTPGKNWRTFYTGASRDVEVANHYGAPTLILNIVLNSPEVRRQGETLWEDLDRLSGGYTVELAGHSAILQDVVARRTITRESLYGPVYRRTFS